MARTRDWLLDAHNWVPLDAFPADEIDNFIKTTMETPPEQCRDGYETCVDILVTLLEYHLEYLWCAYCEPEDPHSNAFYWSWKMEGVWGNWTRAVCDPEELEWMDEQEMEMDVESATLIADENTAVLWME